MHPHTLGLRLALVADLEAGIARQLHQLVEQERLARAVLPNRRDHRHRALHVRQPLETLGLQQKLVLVLRVWK